MPPSAKEAAAASAMLTEEALAPPPGSEVGRRVGVWWADDKRYYNGVVKDYKASNGKHQVVYDDGEKVCA
jgi:hypothetical protein